ncbi:MAG: hypothetical protein DI535_04770 [Citrobacter freundii]|nr:MAG: hypothetical protein DI535_04770 [Citrobacter freundii]
MYAPKHNSLTVVAALKEMIYEPIRHSHELDQLNIGDLLIRYPLYGPPVAKIDLSIPQQFDLYQIITLDPIKVLLLLRRNIESTCLTANMSEQEIAAGNSTFILVAPQKLLMEKIWWRLTTSR